MGTVTCGGCGLKFNRNLEEKSEYIKSKWYHPGCAKIKHEKLALDALICKIFNLKAPGPLNNALIKKYREKYGFNYLGMSRALEYFYFVKKHSADESEERVGIIPYIYKEAQEYYYALEQEKITRSIKPEDKKEEIIVSVNEQREKISNKSELDELFNEE